MSAMFTLPNVLSLLRIPLALLFLHQSVAYRAIAILIAMITDCLDGFLARRYSLSSKIGTTLDPLSDKFFVMFVLSVFIAEDRLSLWDAAAFICRDFSVVVFGIYLALTGNLANYKFRAIWCGKITTTLQFIVLLGLTLRYQIPDYVFSIFIVMGLLALVELYVHKGRKIEA